VYSRICVPFVDVCLFVATMFLVSVATAEAKPTLPHIISDHMVLQRHHAIRLWGWAEPGERITVSLGAKKRETLTLANRMWRVEFPPLDEGGPLTLTVTGQSTIVVRDVLIGEVWIASGQSNMDYALSRSEGGDAAIAKAANPEIRLFKVPRASSLEPRDDVATGDAGWRVCTPEAVVNFSAVAYYFARDLQGALDVPIGIVQSTWSGSPAELWVDEAELAREPDFKPILDRWDTAPALDKAIARAPVDFRLEIDDVELLSHSPNSLSSFDDGKVRTSTGGRWTATEAPECTFELTSPGRNGAGSALAYSGRIGTADALSAGVCFHRDRSPVDMSRYTGIRFQARGKGFFRVHVSEPSITDWDDYAAPIFELTDAWQSITVRFEDLKQSGWGVQLPFTPKELTGFSIDVMKGPGEWTQMAPSSLYNAMVAPLTKYAIRGALWYQGEGNASRAFQYRKLLPALIRCWRAAWD
jgi:sialate O-acetylesterase